MAEGWLSCNPNPERSLSDKLYNGLCGVVHSVSKTDGVKVQFKGFTKVITVQKVTFTGKITIPSLLHPLQM
ncbi:hypothetical protein DPMN_046590 [Dreissena polymorpha]|uniref:Uncharacterized protein n=1 Tax=Dreissena polymorpha TaxID=45954 RepID=A0A9D4HYB4_DREPO|nr:hypothetical protein DPMN_046590 [Dreissena polymorpha]